MDANGRQFWFLGNREDWSFETPQRLSYDPHRRTLRLRSHGGLPFDEAVDQAEARLAQTNAAFDGPSARAWIAPDGALAADGAVAAQFAGTTNIRALWFGAGQTLYVATTDSLQVAHRTGLWSSPAPIPTNGFAPYRLTDRVGDAERPLILDRQQRQLAVVDGALPPAPGDELRLTPLPAAFADDEDPVDVATSIGGLTVVLVWTTSDAAIRLVNPDGSLRAIQTLRGLRRPVAIAWADEENLLVMAPTASGTGLATYPFVIDREQLDPSVASFPRLNLHDGPFVRSTDGFARIRLRAVSPADPPRIEVLDAILRERIDPAEAIARSARVPWVQDQRGTFAWLDAGGDILASGAAPASRTLVGAPTGLQDMRVTLDGILLLALATGIRWIDLKDRWDPTTLSAADFGLAAPPDRLAADGKDGTIGLDTNSGTLIELHGHPLPRLMPGPVAGDVFRPHPENSNPPRLRALPEATFDADETPIAIAGSPEGTVFVLCWRPDQSAVVRRLTPRASGLSNGTATPRRLAAPQRLAGVRRPYSFGFIDEETLVVLVATEGGGTTAVAYPFESFEETEASVLEPLGDHYPLGRHDEGPLVQSTTLPASYVSLLETLDPPGRPRPLRRMQTPQIASRGQARENRRIDSGTVGTIWHRAYLEAVLPQGCGARLRLAATETAVRPPPDAFFEHAFGAVSTGPQVPTAAWVPATSELPFHEGLLPCPPERNRAGLFDVLIQREGRAVRSLTGRYLWIELELEGNGRKTPEVAALRLYGPRFSYARSYLPELYHEQRTVLDDAHPEGPQPGTPPDFLERMLANFEGVFTAIEGRIAEAHLLTDPTVAPVSALPWLGSWLGLTLAESIAPEQRRQAVARAMELYQWRGTLRGLALALDLATAGMATAGDLVIVEQFRLRRTFATILGADLADEEDPLTAGLVDSGNSLVGDTLLLGDEHHREFLALFQDRLPEPFKQWALEDDVLIRLPHRWRQEVRDVKTVQSFYARFAHRLTVLVHRDVDDDMLRRIQRVVDLEAPCGLDVTVVRASHPFIVGLASLAGVDTYLRNLEPVQPVVVGQSHLGRGAVLTRPASLDPRLEGGA